MGQSWSERDACDLPHSLHHPSTICSIDTTHIDPKNRVAQPARITSLASTTHQHIDKAAYKSLTPFALPVATSRRRLSPPAHSPPSPCPTLARQSREHHCSPRPKTLACPRGCQNLQSHPSPTEIVKATECPDQGTAASPTRGLSMVPVQSSARPRLPPRDSRPRIRREQHLAMCLARTSSPALVHLA